MFDLQNINSSMLITKILSTCYTTLNYTIKEYRPSELYASQWLGLIMNQALATRDYNDIQAGRTLTELIDNNKRILESRIEPDTIKKFIEFLSIKDKDPKFVEILRAIVICNGDPMIKNQKELSKLLLNNTKVKTELIFLLKKNMHSGEMLVNPKDIKYDGWVSLTAFGSMSHSLDNGKLYKYFMEMTELLSGLCMDKAYIAIEELKDVYTYEYCSEIFLNEVYDKKLRKAFCNLLTNLWINIAPFKNMNIPEYIQIWNDLDKEPQICHSAEDTTNFIKLKDYLTKYLLCAFEHEPAGDDGDNSEAHDLSLSILELCDKMLQLGYFKTLDELNIMIRCMKKVSFDIFGYEKKLMARADGFALNKEELENEAETLNECKIRVCQIFKYIIAIQTDYQMKVF